MKKLILSVFAASTLTLSASAFTPEFILKGRGGLAQINSSIKTGDKGTKATQQTKNGWLGELAIDYLLTKNVALEVSGGYGLIEVKNIKNNKKSLSFVPITGTAMFRLPMYDKFFPYVGAGYSYKLFSGGPQGTTISNSGGLVLQAGSDFFFEGMNSQNPLGFNIDVKYYLKSQTKVTEKQSGITEKFSNKMSEATILVGIVAPF